MWLASLPWMSKALVTGGAGFIGSSLVASLLETGWEVDVVDDFDPFYPEILKRERVEKMNVSPGFRLIEGDIRDLAGDDVDLAPTYDVVVHLAALAGVRPSMSNAERYYDVNVGGTAAVIDMVRKRNVPRLVFASSSSVYGVNPNLPWQEGNDFLHPISVYAGTKLAGERQVERLTREGIEAIALRFFTVYGPGQRPDLAITKFAARMLNGDSIPIYGDGTARRDFTFVDDTVRGILAAMTAPLTRYEVVNLARGETVDLGRVIEALERTLGVSAVRDVQPPVEGDVPATWGVIDRARELLGYEPSTSVDEGIEKSVDWFHRVAQLT